MELPASIETDASLHPAELVNHLPQHTNARGECINGNALVVTVLAQLILVFHGKRHEPIAGDAPLTEKTESVKPVGTLATTPAVG